HVKLIKPDIRIFQKILDKYFLKTEETLFIDDLKANVHTAVDMGFQTIHLTEHKKLKELLIKRNII
ncbi:MAG: HAD-IA family hydrolase, partial [Spirochaetaceae bacterium]|nr:HAD-IA family hydrolase [Spirochaetaceae bacterium]